MAEKKGKTEEKTMILVVDDEAEILDLLDRVLKKAGYKVTTALNGEEALEKISKETPSLILLDIMMPVMDGIEVKNKLNEDSSTASIPVIFLTSRSTISDKVKGFNLGIDDYITKPFEFKELLARVTSALSRREYYEEISMTDGLTGLYNIHYFKKEFKLFFDIAKRYKKTFSLAIVDVDDFKKINDTYSHAVGDFVLKKVSSVIKETLRKSDIITRYGGDEFVVIFPESNREQSARAMERVKEKIEGKEFIFEDTGAGISFTISTGIAAFREDFENEIQLFEAADEDMYREKKIKQKNAGH
ncbi:MAG: diguanylate cyclase [Candidatus Omnitrophota bacterium]